MLGTNGDRSNGNKNVIDIYDVLYLISPLKNAICTKSGNQYCVDVISIQDSSNGSSSSTAAADSGNNNGNGNGNGNGNNNSTPASSQTNNAPASSQSGSSSSASASSASPSTTSSSSHSTTATTSSTSSAASASSSSHAKRSLAYPASSLYKRNNNVFARDQDTLGSIAPEAAQYNTIGLPYLFITPNLTATELCTPCTSSVVGSYITFESITPYALGIANSPMLSGQVTLWNKIKSTCPQDFTAGLLNNATAQASTAEDNTGGASRGVQVGGAVSKFVGGVVVALLGGAFFF
jgi:cobalamin biosynthesis Mg chelatase CobN